MVEPLSEDVLPDTEEEAVERTKCAILVLEVLKVIEDRDGSNPRDAIADMIATQGMAEPACGGRFEALNDTIRNNPRESPLDPLILDLKNIQREARRREDRE